MIDDGNQDNRYLCRNCNQKRNGTKRLTMDISPSILVISLKRFWWELSTFIPGSNQGKRQKIYHTINVPYMLDTVRLKIGTAYYMLMGVAVHSGDAYHGHYFSVTRSMDDALFAYNTKNYSYGQWQQQNDVLIRNNLSNIDLRNYISGRQRTTPYQYYYKRVDVVSMGPVITVPEGMNMQIPSAKDININDGCDVAFDHNEWNEDRDDKKQDIEDNINELDCEDLDQEMNNLILDQVQKKQDIEEDMNEFDQDDNKQYMEQDIDDSDEDEDEGDEDDKMRDQMHDMEQDTDDSDDDDEFIFSD